MSQLAVLLLLHPRVLRGSPNMSLTFGPESDLSITALLLYNTNLEFFALF